MTVTASSFRVMYPEFGDSTAYPDGQISAWISQALLQQDAGRWGALIDLGTMLFTAHNLVLSARAQTEASFGKPPGQASGPVSNKSVDKVSIGYDTGSAAEENGGAWNMTVYGQQFLRLARQIGIGPVQSAPGPYCGVGSSMYAYAGPYPWT